jgi:phospholipid/cholesterol/gamma-HCH transport system substrate-binding protein
MARLDKRTFNDMVKLLVFIVVTTLATSVLVATIGNITFSGKTEYHAVFVDATGVVSGDDVRIAGVKVGAVEEIDIVDRDRARVTFTVDDGTDLSDSTHAAIRFRNLVGQRYISLTQDPAESGILEEGGTIPVERTSPSLDLTVLFNGFKPLFQALSPDDINKLSYEIVQVFQGEGGTLENLLGHTASITQTLADRDQVIGDLIENLDYVLDHVADRDGQLTDLIQNFRTLVGGLKDDRQAILASLDGISELSVQTADLVKGIRPSFVEDIKQLRRVAGNVDRNKAELDRALQVLPIKLEKIGRTATYGSWFNFYLCNFKASVTLPGGLLNTGKKPLKIPEYTSGAKRCDLG